MRFVAVVLFSLINLLAAHADVVINDQTITTTTVMASHPSSRLVTAAQPNANDLSALAKAGVTVVIDLRGDKEDRGFDETATNQQLGLQYIKMPINGADDITFAKAAELDQLLQQHREHTVLLHCASSNRVGALLALRAAQQGVTRDQALAIGRASGMKSLESKVQTLLEQK